MIKAEHLTKCYGDFMAVNDLSFEIAEGHVYGFLGPNGAGKSTTMNMMTGCLSATSGRILIGGHDIYEEPEAAKRLIGYLPEQPPLYMNETPVEYLQFVGEAKGLRKQELRRQIEEVIGQTGLEDVRHQIIGTLSKGYRQRVGIAQALLGNPRIIILDEPTVGLDPIQIIEIRELIRSLGENHTVILSSHILSEVQAICEKVMIISKGRLVAFDTPENLEAVMTRGNGITFSVLAEEEQVRQVLEALGQEWEWTSRDNGDDSVTVTVHSQVDQARSLCCGLFFAFAEAELPIFEMNTRKANLEEVFLELTENAQAPEGTSVRTAGSKEASASEEVSGSEESPVLNEFSGSEGASVLNKISGSKEIPASEGGYEAEEIYAAGEIYEAAEVRMTEEVRGSEEVSGSKESEESL